jgi:hypothetical protein
MKTLRAFLITVAAVLTVTTSRAATTPLDSQVVLRRYIAALDALEAPKNMIFTYGISQAGPTNIEQHHRVYRSGDDVREETLAGDGTSVKPKATAILKREDRYAVQRVAPRPGAYGFVFVRTVMQAGQLMYVYDTLPYSGMAASGFTVTQVSIDGVHFLPRTITFRATNGAVAGNGNLQYAPVGAYWMPVNATVTVTLGGKPARERISWSDYRFPASLPALTFQAAKSQL